MIFTSKKEEIIAENPVLDPVHIISIAGIERADLPFFLAKILEQRNTVEGFRNVLLIDNSDSKNLFRLAGGDTEEAQINRMTFMKDIAFDDKLFSGYSFVIFYHGFDIDVEILNKSDLVIMSTDYDPNTNRMLAGLMKGYDGEIQMVYRDWATKKIKENLIEEILEIDSSQVEMRSVIKLDIADVAAYIALLYNGNQRLNSSGLSELFMETLRYLTEKITGADEKTIKSLIKKAR